MKPNAQEAIVRTAANRFTAIALLAMFVLFPGGCGRDQGGEAERAAEGTAGRTDGGAAADTLPEDITGFQTPESVLYDPAADAYIVSNINGDPLAKDDNGFLSRVSPDGAVQALKWVDGASGTVTLNAPKGMAFQGDTLFVADIDSVRAFHRVSGAPIGARGVPGASFLNDVAVGPDGTLFVTDTGVGPGFQPGGNDAVYRFEGAEAVALAKDPALSGPNGIVAADDSLTMVGFGGPAVLRMPFVEAATPRTVAILPAGQLDGIVRLNDGSLLVSSWEANAIFRVPAGGGSITSVVDSVASPADIGWDSRRSRLLIPLFQENRVTIREVR